FTTACPSSSLLRRPNVISPHEFVVFGKRLTMFKAALLKSEGSTRLPTNGERSAIARPALHVGDAKAVKSPASIAAVGTYFLMAAGSCRSVVPCYPPKKNNLFFAIGPPAVPPN